MIPKKINYIWLGKKDKSNFANICINSWHDKLRDYEIIEWNETNIDIEMLCKENKFLSECKKRKLWAFMADYLRLYILYNNGGVYMDVDVQVIKPFDDLLDNNIFIGYEYYSPLDSHMVTHGTGLIASEPGNPIIGKCLDFYEKRIWETDVYFIPTIVTLVFNEEPVENYKIYPVDYFAPYDYRKKFDQSCITENTYAVHWFEGSWHENKNIGQFLQVKHIKNPMLKKIIQMKKMIGYYRRRYKQIFGLEV
jgi:mannosyltransferase OCH1-like enzyme